MNQLIVVVVVLCNIKLYNAAVSLNIARAEIKAVRVNFYAIIFFILFPEKSLLIPIALKIFKDGFTIYNVY